MKKILNNPFRVWLALCLLGLVVLSSSVYVGYGLGIKYPETILVKNIVNVDPDFKTTGDFSVFWQVWGMIKSDYLRSASTTEKLMVYGAIDGLVNSLGDPNTVFFPPEDAQKFTEDVNGKFGGIGAEIGIRNEQLLIVAPLKDSPAEKAGIRSGDKILAIDKENTNGIKVNDAVKKIRGEIGTKVTLAILRNGWETPRDFTIVRGEIIIPTLDFKRLPDEVGYIRIRSFNENAPQLFLDAARELLAPPGLNGMILDLRDDPGGFLEVAVNIAGWFMDPNSVVAVQEYSDPANKRVYTSYGNGVLKPIPIVVIVNQGSASASEILAGALRDNIGAVLVGEETFGKGTVQELRRLKDGSSLKLTISHWLLPKGDMIDKNGINPDYEVKLSEEDIKAERDPQLDKAKSIMNDLIKKMLAKQPRS